MAQLHHPMVNHLWSGGGVNEDRKSVVLLVWQDNVVLHDDRWFVEILQSPEKTNAADDKNGRNERERHIKLIEDGYDCFLIMQIAVDSKASPRSRASFQDRDLRIGGEIITGENGRRMIEMVGRIEVYDFVRLEAPGNG